MRMIKKNKLVDWYLELDKEYSEKYCDKTIIFMEVGSFYELYAINDIQYQKLQDICKILSIRITRKNNKNASPIVDSGNPYMAGVTSIAFDKYCKILVNNNYNIVRVDQVTEPPNPKREVVKVYSPSCHEYELDNNLENFLLILFIEGYNCDKYSIGSTLIDLTTGKSICFEFHDKKTKKNFAVSETYRILFSYNIKEIIVYTYNAGKIGEHILKQLNIDCDAVQVKNIQEQVYKDISYQETILKKYFKCPASLLPHDYLGLDKLNHATISLLYALEFITNHDRHIAKYLNKPLLINSNDQMMISTEALKILDVVGENGNSKNSLFKILDKCQTSMGKRLLKSRLINPITDGNELKKRYHLIELVGDSSEVLEKHLKFLYDLDRLHRKLAIGRLDLNDFTNLHNSYVSINKILSGIKDNQVFYKYLNIPNKILDDYKDFQTDYNKKLHLRLIYKYTQIIDISENIFLEGVDSELDILQNKINNNNEKLETFRKLLNEISNDPTSKKKPSDVSLEKNKDGYYYKLPKIRSRYLKDQLKKKDLEEKINTEIISIDILKSLVFKEKTSEVNINCMWLDQISKNSFYLINTLRNKSKVIFNGFLEKWSNQYLKSLEELSCIISIIDLTLSNYNISNKYHYCKPNIIDGNDSSIIAENLRHPITERVRSDILFVPNPVHIGSLHDNKYGAIITGLNGVGKSIYIKSVALSVIMAQAGFFVPADEFKFIIYNKLFTRIGNNDNLFRGQSTFYKEMLELDNILRHADSKTLVVADELCSGSEQSSAQAILASTIITLSDRKCTNLITTHFHNCLDYPEIKEIKNALFYHFKIDYNEGDIVYDRHLIEGQGPRLYGIEVSKYIIDNQEFLDKCYEFRNSSLNKLKPEDVKSSKYNKQVVVEKCEVCGITSNDCELHTHHINEQCEADKYDNIGYISKNTKGNLVVLCQNHHNMVHHGNLDIKGWKQSLNKGKYLEYSFNNNLQKKNERRKYDHSQVILIKQIKSCCNSKTKVAKQYLQNNLNFKAISEITIRKIWNNTY